MTTHEEILNTPMGMNDADASTVREYLIALLLKVWKEDEGFDGKRPFGNSSWWTEIGIALHAAGIIEDGHDFDSYSALVRDAIKSLSTPPPAHKLNLHGGAVCR